MTTNTSLIKASGLTFLLYVALSVVCSIVLTGIWPRGVDTSTLTTEQLMLMAETAPFIKTGSAIIGIVSAVVCAFILSLKKTVGGYRPAIYFAAMLVLYGAISIALHPEHTLIQQAAKVLMPFPLCLLGAWLAHRFAPALSASPNAVNG